MTRDGCIRWRSTLLPGVRAFAVWALWVFSSLVFTVAAHAQDSANQTVYLAGSGNTALDQHIGSLLQDRLGDGVTLLPISDDQIPLIENTPVVSVGPAAFSRVRQANRSTPILAMLVQQSFIDGFAELAPGQISGVLYDVPLLRQALTGKAILPQANTVAILATPGSVELYEPLLDQLPLHGMTARVFVVESDGDLIPTLVRALGYGDFLLAAPDDAIYNPRTIKHILLTAYRRNKIVIGPSQAYVRAGALASSYAPFPEMANLGANALKDYFATGQFPAPSYPTRYRVEINDQVARSLNIPIPDREALNQAIQDELTNAGGPQGD